MREFLVASTMYQSAQIVTFSGIISVRDNQIDFENISQASYHDR